ncbi:glycosyltransferase family 4 protein [Francisella tularensis]|uniref:Glycosyl transferases group 1 family protein n=3 Tax=Francisella tularensis TaxID=263 RepID=Q5NGP3_FRATT|nr:glycosyltransferase family 4 protein [Francisella tularensis]AAV28896.1 NT02FT0325 [synthetic construct]ACD30955.1 glycosyl transferase group 1 family protein [Francisella tularensis subsp. mediasiatica FSC147]ABO46497.1 glycosyl transferase group 1 family protein [Francisella tularensis subsp. tularensis WY96-3418]ADA78479.1 glycosyl transferase group 1 family protein [Francisella tularensis subsp. tularensis NE061598]AFB78904.1 Glycosyltransferase [Francisella tularensis subsp. tularensis
MKILHVFKSFYPYTYGGIEKFIHELSIATAKKYNVEIHILAMGKENQTIDKDFYTLHFAKTNLNIASTTFSFSAIKKFKELAKQVDIIHYHFPYPYADLLQTICRLKKPYIVTYHSDIIKQKRLMMLYKPLMKRFLNGAKYILPTSPNYLETSETLREIKVPKKVIPMSLNKSDYNIDEENYKYWQQKLNFRDTRLREYDNSIVITNSDPESPLYNQNYSHWKNNIGFEKFFIYIGALRYYKGLDVLIDAMQGQDYPLVIVSDGNQKELLEQKVKQNNLQNVKFVGALDDKDKISLLKLSYALVLPSNIRTEAFGLVLLEASMFAKPMITCEIGTGTTFVNINKQTGLVAKPNDSQDLAKKLKELWQDEQKAQEYGANAKARFDDIFSLDKMVVSYKSVYDEVIDSGVK